MELLVNVINQKLKIASNLKTLVEGTQEFIHFKFNLDSEWSKLKIFAQFAQDDIAYNVYLDSNNSADLPPEIKAGRCTLMLYGVKNTVIATSNYLELTISDNILVSNASSIDITPTLYAQLVAMVEQQNKNIEAVDNRVSNLIKGISSTSSSDFGAEVLDIRVGYDGKTYDTAGDAVRAIGEETAKNKKLLGGVSLSITPDGALNIAHDGDSSNDANGVDIMTDTTAKDMAEAIKVIAAANLSISRHLPKLRRQVEDLKNLVDSNKTAADEADEALSVALANLTKTISALSNTVNDNKKSIDSSLSTLDTALSNLTKEVANNKKTASDTDVKLANDIATTNETIESLGLTVIDGKLCVKYKV